MGLEIFKFLWFWGSEKWFFTIKLLNQTRSTENQESSAHRFLDNYLANYTAKFLQNGIKPWRVLALRVCTGYHFFKRKSLLKAF